MYNSLIMKYLSSIKLPKFSIILGLYFLLLFLTGSLSLYEKKSNFKIIPNPVNKINPPSVQKENLTKPDSQSFEWTVEKVDEHLTRLQLPADDHMSTADELFEAMNNYRKANNIRSLEKTPGICEIADKRAQEQLANGELDGHSGFDKHVQDQNEFQTMGEVLFGGSQPQSGVHIVEFGWNRSLTGHKEAIRDPDWHYGCGGIAGYFAVFVFGRK